MNIRRSGLFTISFHGFLLRRYRRVVVQGVLANDRQVFLSRIAIVNFFSGRISGEIIMALVKRRDYLRAYFFRDNGGSFLVVSKVRVLYQGNERRRQGALVDYVQLNRRVHGDHRTKCLQRFKVYLAVVAMRQPVRHAKDLSRCRCMGLPIFYQVHNNNVRDRVLQDLFVVRDPNVPLRNGRCIVTRVSQVWVKDRLMLLVRRRNHSRQCRAYARRGPHASPFPTSGTSKGHALASGKSRPRCRNQSMRSRGHGRDQRRIIRRLRNFKEVNDHRIRRRVRHGSKLPRRVRRRSLGNPRRCRGRWGPRRLSTVPKGNRGRVVAPR